MTKEQALDIVVSCAKQYDDNLKNKNLLFLYNDNNKTAFIETLFLRQYFMHLTGVCPLMKSDSHYQRLSPNRFYEAAVGGKLSTVNIILDAECTAEMKLSVLSAVMNIHKTGKMIGEYNHIKPMLMTEKIVGTVVACLGFVEAGGYYVPNTVLRENIKGVTCDPQKRILTILAKNNTDKVYSIVTYIARGINFKDIIFPEQIKDKVAANVADLLTQQAPACG